MPIFTGSDEPSNQEASPLVCLLFLPLSVPSTSYSAASAGDTRSGDVLRDRKEGKKADSRVGEEVRVTNGGRSVVF